MNEAKEEAEKVKALEGQLVELKEWSAEDKKTAVANLEAEMHQKHQQVLDALKEKHEAELKAHEDMNNALDSRLKEELRIMKEMMEQDKEEALTAATDHAGERHPHLRIDGRR